MGKAQIAPDLLFPVAFVSHGANCVWFQGDTSGDYENSAAALWRRGQLGEPGAHGAAASISFPRHCSHALPLVPDKLPYSREHANHQMCHR